MFKCILGPTSSVKNGILLQSESLSTRNASSEFLFAQCTRFLKCLQTLPSLWYPSEKSKFGDQRVEGDTYSGVFVASVQGLILKHRSPSHSLLDSHQTHPSIDLHHPHHTLQSSYKLHSTLYQLHHIIFSVSLLCVFLIIN